MALGTEVGLAPGHFVLDGGPVPLSQKGAQRPLEFAAHVYCGQPAGWIKMALGMAVGLDPSHTVQDWDPAPLPKGAQTPQFSAHICCGQMAAWIKMSLGMELGLGPGDFVLDGVTGTPLPLPKRGANPPNFRPMFNVIKRLYG